MKKKTNTKAVLFCIISMVFFCNPQLLHAQCSHGPLTVTGDSIITGGCIINGNLTILNNGALNVDMTGAGNDTFIVRGNILLQGNAQLWIHADSGSVNKIFIVSNTPTVPRSITEQNSSTIALQNIEFRTQEGDLTNDGSLTMSCNSYDSAQLIVTNTFLDPTKAWLLHNLNNQSALSATNTQKLPTEVYINDSASVQILQNSNVGLWLNLDSTYTLNLPLQTGSNYNWLVGGGNGGLATHWYLSIVNSNPGINITVQPTAQVIVNGHGSPATGEIHVGMQFAGHNDTLTGLHVGLQNSTVGNRVTFNNVQLGPIAWQLYILYNETMYVSNSTINEIGVAGPGSQITVDSSILQLAQLAAIGTNSSITVNNAQIWNQVIQAANSSNITFNNCGITGSLLIASDTGSTIYINNSCYYSNPAGCTQNTMVNIATGVPNCNPYRPAGLPSTTGSGSIVKTGTCTTSITETDNPAFSVTASPNPFSTQTNIAVTGLNEQYCIELYDITGRLLRTIQSQPNTPVQLNRNNLASGVYLYGLNVNGKRIAFKKLVVQ